MYFNCEDIEMMETEDITDSNDRNDSTGSQSTPLNTNNESSNKRNFCDTRRVIESDVESDLTQKCSQISSNESRNILRAKRFKTIVNKETIHSNNKSFNKMISNQTFIDHKKRIYVLDTNILLTNLCELKTVIISEEKSRKRNTNQTKIESFIIPWIVVQELDHMKNGINSKFTDTKNAIHFINEQLKSNGLVKGENYDKNEDKICKKDSNEKNENLSESRIALVDEEINDDKIINSCLKIRPLNRVILLSNDINLCNKALMKGFKAMLWSEFYKQYSEKNNFNCDNDVDEEPQTKRFAKSTSHSKTLDNSQSLRFSLSPKFSFVSKTASAVFGSNSQIKSDSPVKSCPSSSSKKKSPIKQISQKSSPKKSIKRIALKYDEWIRFRYECEQQLLKFIVSVYQNIWQNDWELMLEINRRNATLQDMIRLIRKEWCSNFSDHFNRDSSIKSLIDNLHTNLQNESNYQLLSNDLKRFIAIVKEKQIFINNEVNSFKKRKTI